MNQFTVKRRLRSLLGPSVQTLACSTGLVQMLGRLRQCEGTVILKYHSVADTPHSKFIDPANHVSVKVFTHQMKFLARKRTVISLDELTTALQEGKTLQSGTVVVTFDDGYLDNLTIAAPILKQYKIPATLFLPTGYIDRGETQWIDQIYTTFQFSTVKKMALGESTYDLRNLEQRKKAYDIVCKSLLTGTPDNRLTLLTEMYDRLRPSTPPPRLTMNWDEVKSLQERYKYFQFGGHTVEHTDLTNVSEGQAIKDITTCTQRIHDKLGVIPSHFSFCYGRTSNSLRRLMSKTTVKSACGGEGINPVIEAPADIMRLPRIVAPTTMRCFDLLTSSANTGVWRKITN